MANAFYIYENLWSNFMAKAELGNKHLCNSCNTKFYDLQKEVPICPKCGEEIIIKVKPRLGRPPLNKNIQNIIKPQTKEKVTSKSNDAEENNIESDMEDLISIEEIDENIIDPENDLDIEENQDSSDNITDIANIDLDNKDENTDI